MFVNTLYNKAKSAVKGCRSAIKRGSLAVALFMAASVSTFAQNAAGDYSAGTQALSQVSEEIAKYIPIVVQLCYAIAGVVAILGAISVYIAMNNEEQDVKNILVLQKWFENKRNQIKDKLLTIKALGEYFNFPILAEPTLK